MFNTPQFSGNYKQFELPSELFNANGQVTYNGVTYNVSNHGDGTRDISPVSSQDQAVELANKLNQQQIAYNQPAIQGLTAAGGTLQQAYGSLLQSITTGSQAAANQVTQTTEQALAQRGLLPSSYLAGTNLAANLLPTAATYGGLAGSTTMGESSDLVNLASQIGSLQAGNYPQSETTATNMMSTEESWQAALLAAQNALQLGSMKIYSLGNNGQVINSQTGQITIPNVSGGATPLTNTGNTSNTGASGGNSGGYSGPSNVVKTGASNNTLTLAQQLAGNQGIPNNTPSASLSFNPNVTNLGSQTNPNFTYNPQPNPYASLFNL